MESHCKEYKDFRYCSQVENHHVINADMHWAVRKYLESGAQVYEHIERFPYKILHYGNEHRYLDAKLNVRIMYRLFCKAYKNSTVKYLYYLKYFNENFNLSFGRPQIDVCGTCKKCNTQLKNSNTSSTMRKKITKQQNIHKWKTDQFYSKLDEVKELCATTCLLSLSKNCFITASFQCIVLMSIIWKWEKLCSTCKIRVSPKKEPTKSVLFYMTIFKRMYLRIFESSTYFPIIAGEKTKMPLSWVCGLYFAIPAASTSSNIFSLFAAIRSTHAILTLLWLND